jgi:hypothetical protein
MMSLKFFQMSSTELPLLPHIGNLNVSEIFCLRLEDELEEVDKEVKLLQQQSNAQAELDLQRESKAMKESEVRKL